MISKRGNGAARRTPDAGQRAVASGTCSVGHVWSSVGAMGAVLPGCSIMSRRSSPRTAPTRTWDVSVELGFLQLLTSSEQASTRARPVTPCSRCETCCGRARSASCKTSPIARSLVHIRRRRTPPGAPFLETVLCAGGARLGLAPVSPSHVVGHRVDDGAAHLASVPLHRVARTARPTRRTRRGEVTGLAA